MQRWLPWHAQGGSKRVIKEMIPTMTRPVLNLLATAVLAGAVNPAAHAAAVPVPTAAEQAAALDLAMKEIAIRSVRGEANRTPEVAALVRERLIAGGWAPGDVVITRRWLPPGRAPTLRSSRWCCRAIWMWSRPNAPIGSAIRLARWSRTACYSGAARPT
jgi:hypothetical protein